MALPSLPPQSSDVAWPTHSWPRAELGPEVDAARIEVALQAAFREPVPESHGETLALAVVQGGRLVLERYAPGRGPEETFVSWSMAKSITHALVGIGVGAGKLAPEDPAPVPAWQEPGDPRRAIRLEDLLRMVDGLDFVEVYEEENRSDVIDMLFRSGKDDVAGYAEARPAVHRPGTWWNYSSGTSNVVAAILGRVVGGGREGMEGFIRASLFEPLGMRSAKPRFDAAGTFIGSSYVFATARDFARFGLLYLRDGIWEDRRLLPAGWVDHGRTPTPASSGHYGAHWWLALDGSGRFSANGFNGQYLVIDPRRDLVLVRLGISDADQRVRVVRDLKQVVEAFPLVEGRT